MEIQQLSHTGPAVHIEADQTEVPMGRTVCITAAVASDGRDYLLLPFVNGRRWGAHERPGADGMATFMLPLPNPGPAQIEVLPVRVDADTWMGLQDPSLLLAGTPRPAVAPCSNVIELTVTRRAFPARPQGDTLFIVQWEPWFTGGARRWHTTQAVPLMGLYDSYNADVTRQHILWFMDLGIDCIMPDWSNHLWGLTHWDQRSDGVNALLHATQLSLEVLATMRDEGLPVPTMAIMPGLTNGPPTTMEALNEELAWIYHCYVRNPRFQGLWQDFDGKPLVAVLDTGAVGDRRGTTESAFRIPFFKQTLGWSEAEIDAFRAAQPPVDETHFTVRWMSSQNQTTRHHELGYWSWMDGVIDPPVTYRDGKAEAVTVTPSFFNADGWTGPLAHGRRGGTTYLKTFEVALQHRPRVVFLHQFNEFTGQAHGHGYGPEHMLYLDTYSVELSDDIEPVSITAPGYRGDQGGWGFYYLNLTRALMGIYRDSSSSDTLLAVSAPARNEEVSGATLRVEWMTLGAASGPFEVALDEKVVVSCLDALEVNLELAGVEPGAHVLTVRAPQATTRYPLSWTALDEDLEAPGVPECRVPFVLR